MGETLVEMTITLQVRDWDQHYENNRTREMKHTAWVPVPNKQDNEGYVQLVSHEDGAAHLGAWLALLQIASRCDPRGTLLRKDGRPHTAASLGLISRLPVAVFDAVIPRLIEIRWIEILEGAQEGAEIAQSPAAIVRGVDQERKNRKEEEQKEQKCAFDKARVDGDSHSYKEKQAEPCNNLIAQQDAWFTEWWVSYWLRKSRKTARAAFGKHVKSQERFNEVMSATKEQSMEMLGREPSKRPHGATWLNGERWTDELLEAASPQRTTLDVVLDRMYIPKGTE
jgi:hypothetical protein